MQLCFLLHSISECLYCINRRRATPLSCCQLHAAAIVKAAVVAELDRRWRPQEGAFGDEQAEGLQPAVGWRQQRTAGAGCDETPPSASVRRRTVGQSPSTASPNRAAWEIGESRKRCLSDSLISAKVSHRWRSWTTNVGHRLTQGPRRDFRRP